MCLRVTVRSRGVNRESPWTLEVLWKYQLKLG